jgi:hypothetical protein
MRLWAVLLLPLVTAACTAVPPSTAPSRPPATGVPPTRPVAPPVAQFRPPELQRIAGLEGVLQQDADGLARLFGRPRLEVREGDARKLQFAGSACVLDVFLYPMRTGSEPVATYVEARRASDGQQVDRVACVQALAAR